MKFDKTDMIVFMSVPRSGHNAVMQWLINQLPCKTTFYSITNIKDNQLVKNGFNPARAKNRVVFHKNKPGHIEVLNAERIDKGNLHALQKTLLVGGKSIYPITVIRTYRNHLASTIRANGIGDNYTKLFKQSWITQCESVLNNDYDFIFFDKWHIDKDYRKSICERYGLEFTDEGKEEIPSIIGASVSSFDGDKFVKETSKMDLLNRYLAVEDHKEYQKFYDDVVRVFDEELMKML